jgi:cytochrome c553
MSAAHGRLVRLAGCVLASLLLATAGSAAHAAGDVKAGRAKALMCQTCHGLDGVSRVPDAPNLAGQVEGYLVTQLRAFKSGARRNESMSVVVSTLSDSDIDNLAAYFAAIEVKVGRIPGE